MRKYTKLFFQTLFKAFLTYLVAIYAIGFVQGAKEGWTEARDEHKTAQK